MSVENAITQKKYSKINRKEKVMAEQKCAWCERSFGDKYREATGNPYCSEKCKHEAGQAKKKG